MATDRGLVTDNVTAPENLPQKHEDSEEDELMKKMRSEAKLRIALEDQVKVNPRIATVFAGLKLNTEHSSAVVYPLLYMVSRVVYALSIVYLSGSPQVATTIVLSCTILTLCFTVHEKQFKDPLMNRLAILNDLLFYVVLVLALGCSSVTTADITEKKILGWVLIIIVTLAVHLNIVAAVVQAIKHIRLLYQRHQYFKMMGAKVAADPV